MLIDRRTQDLIEEYVIGLFGTPPAILRRSLEFGDEERFHETVNVSTASLVDGFAALTGLTSSQVFGLIGISPATRSRSRSRIAKALISLDTADRLYQATHLFARIVSILGLHEAQQWIVHPNAHLDGHAPAALMRTGTGRDRLSRYLGSLEDGTYG